MKTAPLALLLLAACASRPAYFKLYASKNGELFDHGRESSLESCRVDLHPGEIVVRAWGSGRGWSFHAEGPSEAGHVRELVGKTLPVKIFVDRGGDRWAASAGDPTIPAVEGRVVSGSVRSTDARMNLQADFEAEGSGS